MLIIFNLIFSFLLLLGFYFIGKNFVNLFKVKNLIGYISNPKYQYPIFGLSIFLFLSYTLFFVKIFNKDFIEFTSIIFIFFGVFQISLKFKKILFFFKNRFREESKKRFEKNKILVLILLILYFFVSICPPTSGDSVAYHLSVAKYVLNNGEFPTDLYDVENKLASNQEFLNAFALSINAYQFTSLINFVSLVSIISIINNFSKKLQLTSELNFFLILLILSSPVLIFLISSSKHQLFSVSLIFASFAFFFVLKKIKESGEIIKIFFIINILLLTAVSSKINFLLPFFLINIFLFFLKKKYYLKFIIILSILSIFALLPLLIWKSIVYEYKFYEFFLNPLPLNLPGYNNFYFFIKNYLSEKFPLSLILSLNPGEFTNSIGFGCFVLLFLINNLSKKINIYLFLIFIFIIIYAFLGLKSPRFYLEIYFFSIFIFLLVIKKIHKDASFVYFKYLIYFQSILVIISLTYYAILVFPGNFSKKINEKVLNNYADGYSLYSWVNTVIKDDSAILVDHRSTFFLNTSNYIHPTVLNYLDSTDYNSINFYFEIIKIKNPKFIVIHSQKENYSFMNLNLEECIDGLYDYKDKVGYLATRNPFNSNKKHYNGYIYNFKSEKLPGCVKLNKF